jgi:hypothetical protein
VYVFAPQANIGRSAERLPRRLEKRKAAPQRVKLDGFQMLIAELEVEEDLPARGEVLCLSLRQTRLNTLKCLRFASKTGTESVSLLCRNHAILASVSRCSAVSLGIGFPCRITNETRMNAGDQCHSRFLGITRAFFDP